MNRTEFKERFLQLLIEYGSSTEETIELARVLLVEFQKQQERVNAPANRGKPWTDEELYIILSDAPSEENCAKYARLFRRDYGSIEQIYRWSSTPEGAVKEQGRDQDAFIVQIRRVRKRLRLRA